MGHKHHQRLYSRPWLSRFWPVSDIGTFIDSPGCVAVSYTRSIPIYTIPQPTYALSKTVPVRHVRPWNGVYTARDSPGQPHMIVVTDKKLLKFERGHRATRWYNIVGIQRIHDMFTCPRLSCPTLECRIYSTGQSRTATCDRCGTPKAADVQEGS